MTARQRARTIARYSRVIKRTRLGKLNERRVKIERELGSSRHYVLRRVRIRAPRTAPAVKATASGLRSVNGTKRVASSLISRAPAGQARTPPPPPPPSPCRSLGVASFPLPNPPPNPYATLATGTMVLPLT